jgi:hypothetical protein
LNRLPPKVAQLARDMDDAYQDDDVDGFFQAAEALLALTPQALAECSEIFAPFVKKGVQDAEDVECVLSRFEPRGISFFDRVCSKRSFLAVGDQVAKKCLYITRDIARTKQILTIAHVHPVYFWLKHISFVLASCDIAQVERHLMGICAKLDLHIYLKQGNFPRVTHILNTAEIEHESPESTDERELKLDDLANNSLGYLAYEITRVVQDPRTIRQILEGVPERERRKKVVDSLLISVENGSWEDRGGLFAVLQEILPFCHTPRSQCQWHCATVSYHLGTKDLPGAIEALRECYRRFPKTDHRFFAKRCLDLSLNKKDVPSALAIVKLAEDDTVTLYLHEKYLDARLLEEARQVVPLIGDDLNRQIADLMIQKCAPNADASELQRLDAIAKGLFLPSEEREERARSQQPGHRPQSEEVESAEES